MEPNGGLSVPKVEYSAPRIGCAYYIKQQEKRRRIFKTKEKRFTCYCDSDTIIPQEKNTTGGIFMKKEMLVATIMAGLISTTAAGAVSLANGTDCVPCAMQSGSGGGHSQIRGRGHMGGHGSMGGGQQMGSQGSMGSGQQMGGQGPMGGGQMGSEQPPEPPKDENGNPMPPPDGQSGGFSQNGEQPPEPPKDENGNPMAPPDGQSGGFSQNGEQPPDPPKDENGNPMPPPDSSSSTSSSTSS